MPARRARTALEVLTEPGAGTLLSTEEVLAALDENLAADLGLSER